MENQKKIYYEIFSILNIFMSISISKNVKKFLFSNNFSYYNSDFQAMDCYSLIEIMKCFCNILNSECLNTKENYNFYTVERLVKSKLENDLKDIIKKENIVYMYKINVMSADEYLDESLILSENMINILIIEEYIEKKEFPKIHVQISSNCETPEIKYATLSDLMQSTFECAIE